MQARTFESAATDGRTQTAWVKITRYCGWSSSSLYLSSLKATLHASTEEQESRKLRHFNLRAPSFASSFTHTYTNRERWKGGRRERERMQVCCPCISLLLLPLLLCSQWPVLLVSFFLLRTSLTPLDISSQIHTVCGCSASLYSSLSPFFSPLLLLPTAVCVILSKTLIGRSRRFDGWLSRVLA